MKNVPAPDPEDSTRRRVAESILREGPSTARELAERLGLTSAAVRRHLTALDERGEVDSREQRVYGPRGRGRPARVFFLTDRGRTGFHQAYDQLAIQALEYLAKTEGSVAVRRFAEERMSQLVPYFERIRADDPEIDKLEALTLALNEFGYVANRRPAPLGEQLCQHHCPVAQVAAQFPELCQVETEVFGEILGTDVRRLATIAHGDGVCTTHVSAPNFADDFVSASDRSETTQTTQNPEPVKERNS
ncbi:helix-turn-helix transcriptional regulator [Parenemella sanctibonifatiensis]|uniref:helix-turn-helix transcriptional regulator n=1 Tax=Parenemella sanctibonifatiensis TaxID=2016505 RepID=UPI0015C66AD1|nr:metalloregulator ArsR/SmtB family transcription factor [Parenemella sanctibonifatiensis]